MVVRGPDDVGTRLVQFQVERDPERHGPITLDDAPLQIDPDHLRRPEFGPGDQPWVAQQRAVAEVHRDVTRQVVAVALAPQRASKHYKLFPRGQVRYELFSRWREHDDLSPNSRRSPSG